MTEELFDFDRGILVIADKKDRGIETIYDLILPAILQETNTDSRTISTSFATSYPSAEAEFLVLNQILGELPFLVIFMGLKEACVGLIKLFEQIRPQRSLTIMVCSSDQEAQREVTHNFPKNPRIQVFNKFTEIGKIKAALKTFVLFQAPEWQTPS